MSSAPASFSPASIRLRPVPRPVSGMERKNALAELDSRAKTANEFRKSMIPQLEAAMKTIEDPLLRVHTEYYDAARKCQREPFDLAPGQLVRHIKGSGHPLSHQKKLHRSLSETPALAETSPSDRRNLLARREACLILLTEGAEVLRENLDELVSGQEQKYTLLAPRYPSWPRWKDGVVYLDKLGFWVTTLMCGLFLPALGATGGAVYAHFDPIVNSANKLASDPNALWHIAASVAVGTVAGLIVSPLIGWINFARERKGQIDDLARNAVKRRWEFDETKKSITQQINQLTDWCKEAARICVDGLDKLQLGGA